MNAWFVFFGAGELALVDDAANESDAFHRFLALWRDRGTGAVPPARDEVTIRQPHTGDRGWIEDSGDPRFMALLPALSDS